MSTEIDWPALLELAAESDQTLHFGHWRGRFEHARWCPIEPTDPDRGWVGTVKVEPVLGGRTISVELYHSPSMFAIDVSYLEWRGDEDGVEQLAREWAQQLADTCSEQLAGA